MAEQDIITEAKTFGCLPLKVPEYEVQAILHALLQANWYTVDLLTVIDQNLEENPIVENEVSACGLRYMASTASRMMSKQLDLIDMLSEHIGVSSMCCELALDLHDLPDSTKPVSMQYFREQAHDN